MRCGLAKAQAPAPAPDTAIAAATASGLQQPTAAEDAGSGLPTDGGVRGPALDADSDLDPDTDTDIAAGVEERPGETPRDEPSGERSGGRRRLQGRSSRHRSAGGAGGAGSRANWWEGGAGGDAVFFRITDRLDAEVARADTPLRRVRAIAARGYPRPSSHR